MKLYSLYDMKAKAFNTQLQPFRTDAEAVRAVNNMVNADDAKFANAEDFQLWHLGDIDVETGKIAGKPLLVINLAQLKLPTAPAAAA